MHESSSDSAATRPSAPSSAADDGPRPRRAAWLALALAIASAASCWNPLGAPFALAAGLGAAALGVRGLRRERARRGAAAAALGIGLAAAVVAVLVVVRAAGGGIVPERELGITPRADSEVDRALDDAGARTRQPRERAAEELDRLPADGSRGGHATE